MAYRLLISFSTAFDQAGEEAAKAKFSDRPD
jgi:hypothetical protein